VPGAVALANARTKLAHRIGRFLEELDRQERPPSLGEAWCIADSLAFLRKGDYLRGEGAIMAAERGGSHIIHTHDRIRARAQLRSTAEFREELERLQNIVAAACRPRRSRPLS
jgi:hypothetical protein